MNTTIYRMPYYDDPCGPCYGYTDNGDIVDGPEFWDWTCQEIIVRNYEEQGMSRDDAELQFWHDLASFDPETFMVIIKCYLDDKTCPQVLDRVQRRHNLSAAELVDYAFSSKCITLGSIFDAIDNAGGGIFDDMINDYLVYLGFTDVPASEDPNRSITSSIKPKYFANMCSIGAAADTEEPEHFVGEIVMIGYYGGFHEREKLLAHAEIIDIDGYWITLRVYLPSGATRKMFGTVSELEQLEDNYINWIKET